MFWGINSVLYLKIFLLFFSAIAFNFFLFLMFFDKHDCFQTCNVVINIVWYLYAGEWNLSGHWLSVFILQPIAVVLPLLPLVLPIGWIFLNTVGYAKTSAFLQSSFISKVSMKTSQYIRRSLCAIFVLYIVVSLYTYIPCIFIYVRAHQKTKDNVHQVYTRHPKVEKNKATA